jgi:indole-3-glycerol phosphate synthase/phosphoribosylanthranilate isomerase/anthranilate synthase/indole-3-glycerol phosphate synthase/phosphoribosylanthranilate isomerase
MFLQRIVEQTRLDLAKRKQSCSLEEMQRLAIEQPLPRDMLQAFEPRTHIHLIAEIKRASPSKGLLAPHLNPIDLARVYEKNGAAVISVLTEPHFFLGAPEYLTAIKETVHIPVLRKDFIVDDYQVYEARAWGADGILLICALLDDEQLRHLHQTASSLHMHCLVEVHSREEAQRAINAGAVIIGVNSRDLVTFEMNPYLIGELRQLIPNDRMIVAESGIHSAADARRLARYDVQAMLVGESLVVSHDIPTQMQQLLHAANESVQIKICGLRTPEHINAAIEAGADMLGFIFHEPSHRYIEPRQVRKILAESQCFMQPPNGEKRPDLVGVFVNKDADYINEVADQIGLQFVQLHGNQAPDFYQHIRRPIIQAFPLDDQTDLEHIKSYRDKVWRILLDTPTPDWGGSGKTHNWELAHVVAQSQPIILAGGLTPENVSAAIEQVNPWGVDVSSGVETNKVKDMQKIRAFIERVRLTQK